MHEYIKKLSFSLCLLGQIIKDTQFRDNIRRAELSLIDIASDFFVNRVGNASTEEMLSLRKILVKVVDLLDLAKVGKVVSVMNAEIVIAATLRLIEEVDDKLQKNNSFLFSRLSLSEMSNKLLRERAREEEQNKFLTDKLKKDESEILNFTKIPELKLSEPGVSAEELKTKGLSEEEFRAGQVTEKGEPKFDWGNGHTKGAAQQLQTNSQEPIVYTFFGSEDKIIESRKSKLLELLKIGGGVAIGEVTKHFPGLNVKTLQRDLLDLMREKKVIMLGKKRWAKYYLK